MSLLREERVRLLSEAAGESALHRILFDRDESDSFRLRVEAVRPESSPISRAEILPALPMGSRWAGAIGWESYVVYCPKARQQELAVVGLEYVLPHETRGAYPVFAGVALQIRDVAAALHAVAMGLDPDEQHLPPKRPVHHSEARTPEEHRGPAAGLLRAAAAAFSAGARPLLRTAILSEDEVPPKWMILRGNTILGIVPVLYERFSPMTRLVLR